MRPQNHSDDLPRVILLAAGQGSRLGSIAAGRPKALMPVAGEPLLLRTVRQLFDVGFSDITVVIGHLRFALEDALAPWRGRLKLVINEKYANDTNIVSLLLGLDNLASPALVIEADIAFDDEAMMLMAGACRGTHSVWFTKGSFLNYRLGGCLQSDGEARILDLRYVEENGPRFSRYRKILGVVYIGPKEITRYLALLRAAAAQTTRQYYMMPWCDHLAELPARDVDLSRCRTATFNTPEDYDCCLFLFDSQNEIHSVS